MPLTCYKCGEPWEGHGKPGRGDICVRCGSSLRICRNCRFYNPSLHNQCTVPEADFIADKEKANFCEWFQVSSSTSSSRSKNESDDREENANRRWKNLFKDD